VKADSLISCDPANLPAVLAESDAIKPLGMKISWFEVLAKKGHLHCLGGYQERCPRYYATIYISSLKGNLDWLDKAFSILREENKNKNSSDNDKKEGTL